MKVLALYVWREWREYRAAVLGLAGILTVLVLTVSRTTPRRFFGDPIAIATCVAIAMLAVVAVIGGDLLSREAEPSRMRFLERLPARLSVPFVAKLLFLVLVLMLAGSFGWSLAALAAWWRAGDVPGHLLEVPGPALMLGVSLLALWTFAVSAFVPRGSLAAPAAIVILTLFGWPLWCLLTGAYTYALHTGEVACFLAPYVAGAPAAGWWAFSRGRAFGRGSLHAELHGLGVTLLCFLPSWGWGAVRILDATRIHPGMDDFTIANAWVTRDGKRALLTVFRDRPLPDPEEAPPRFAMEVVLETGDWRVLEGPGCWIAPVRPSTKLDVLASARAPDFAVVTGKARQAMYILDGVNGELVDKHYDPFRHDAHSLSWDFAGLGEVLMNGWTPVAWYDPFRKKLYYEEDLFQDREAEGIPDVLVLPDSWVLYGFNSWCRFDPESRTTTPLGWFEGLACALVDGRILLKGEHGLLVGDPRTGSKTPVELVGDWKPRALGVFSNPDWNAAYQGREESILVVYDYADYVGRTCILQPGSHQLVPMDSASADFTGYLDRGSGVFVEDRRGLVEIDVDTGARRTLFPLQN